MDDKIKRELSADPVPRKDVELPPMMTEKKPEGVASSSSKAPDSPEANSALTGISFS